LQNFSWIDTSISTVRRIGRPCLSMAWSMPFRWTHIPWVNSSGWETKPNVHLSTDHLECESW
jgi:hypothetical protein